MKKLTAILLSLVLILSLCSAAMLTVGAEETTASVWDGTANIKWYFDGKDIGEYELKSAADLAVTLEIDLHTGKDWYEAK